MTSVKEQIVEAVKSGTFMAICCSLRLDADAELKQTLTDLHNEGAIDVVEEFTKLRDGDQTPLDYFNMRDVFTEVLPNLTIEVRVAYSCVECMVERAGGDAAARWPWKAFKEFLIKDQKRVKEALQYILKGEMSIDILPSVLLAGLMVNTCLYLDWGIGVIQDGSLSEELRAKTLSVLSNTEYLQKDPGSAEKILNALEVLFRGQEPESVLGNIPCAAVGCAVLKPDLEARVSVLIVGLAKSGLPLVLYGISAAGFLFYGKITPALRWCILSSLVSAQTEHKGIMGNIDFVLTRLIESSQGSEAIEFLFDYLAGHEHEERITSLPMCLRALAGNPSGVLDVFVTRCFLSGDRAHLFAMDHLVRHLHGHQSFEVKMDESQLFEPKSDVARFLARKAIGYFYYIPEACVSYVVSTLDAMGDAEREHLQQIFINPFVLSYSECVEIFLSENHAQLSDVAQRFLKTSLSKTKQFFEDIRLIGEIKELRPSGKQAEAHNRRWGLMMEKSYAEAKKGSIISAICTNINLLHGRGWVTYQAKKDGETRRQVHLLKRVEASVNIPSLWSADPFGLDYGLRIYRAERIVR